MKEKCKQAKEEKKSCVWASERENEEEGKWKILRCLSSLSAGRRQQNQVTHKKKNVYNQK